MIFKIPSTLTHYTPVFNWLFRMFEEHDEIGTETDLHIRIRHLIHLYRMGNNTEKLACDLAEIDCWQTRTIALTDKKVPEYWNPLKETYLEFKKRLSSSNPKTYFKTINIVGAYPARDIVYSHISAILDLSHHVYLDNRDESYKNRYQDSDQNPYEKEDVEYV